VVVGTTERKSNNMDLLATDRAPPRRWAGNSRTSCHFIKNRASRVDKSYAPPVPSAIKDGGRRIVSSLIRDGKRKIEEDDQDEAEEQGQEEEDDDYGQELERMVVDMKTASPPLPPQQQQTQSNSRPNSYYKRPDVPRTISGGSDSSSGSSVSTDSPRGGMTNTGAGAAAGATATGSRPTSTAGWGDMNPPPTTPPSHHVRHSSSSSTSTSNTRAIMPPSPSGGRDQTTLVSPMRKLLLTMPPINDDNSEHANRTAALTKPRPEFYTWENLPPQDLVCSCISAFYSHGIACILCPVPETEAAVMFRSIYGNTATSGSSAASASARNVIRSTNNNFRLCQVLLLAAVGSQYLEEAVTDEARSALFTSGKWYLHMAFGRDANDLQRLRANSLAAVYLIFQKSISVIEHLSE